MAPAHASLTADNNDNRVTTLELPDAALTYATSTSCASTGIRSYDDGELRDLLLSSRATRDSRVRVETSDASNGCKVLVKVYHEASDRDVSALDIAADVHANLPLIGRDPSQQHVRSEPALHDLVLERMALHVANKRYDVVLRGSAREHAAPAASSIALYGAKCSPQLHDAALVLRHVVPSGVDAGSLTVDASNDVAVANGHVLDCAVVLDVTAHAPLLRADSIDDALAYVRAFDAQIDETFDVTDRKRVVATVGLIAPQAPSAIDAALLTTDATAVVSPYNAPTKEMTLGVLAGLFGLVAMLVAVVMMKKRHEQQCEERHRNASKAAQIRRVSIRMASPSRRTRNAFGEEDDEEKEYEAYEEHDGLL